MNTPTKQPFTRRKALDWMSGSAAELTLQPAAQLLTYQTPKQMNLIDPALRFELSPFLYTHFTDRSA